MRGLGCPRTRGMGEEVWLSAQRLGCGYGGSTVPSVRGGRVARERVSEWHRRMVGIDGADAS